MCGIGGIVDFSHLERPSVNQHLKSMAQRLQHRGPDFWGTKEFERGGFTHTRLSIIDLDPRSNQPFASDDNSLLISFNGEIYNFQELRRELEQKGATFRTQSDTEVILMAYKTYGTAAFEKLRGIFAFAIWDSNRDQLFLVRDPLGIKPLYYSLKSQKIVFGSELKAVLAAPEVSTSWDFEQLNCYLTFGYTSCPDTGLRDVKQLEPCHYLCFSGKGAEIHKYWDWQASPLNLSSSNDYQSEFERLFFQAVSSQVHADVPVVSFLSGGLDSTAIAYALSELGRKDIQLFSYRFKADGFDESTIAKEVSEILNLKLEVLSQEQQFRDLPQQISFYLEDPMADSSSLPMFLLCQGVAQKYKVALSGDGADEMLAGYPTYKATHLSNRLNSWGVGHALRPLRGLTSLIPKSSSPYSLYQKSHRFLEYGSKPFPYNHAGWRSHFSKGLKKQSYSVVFKNEISQDFEKPYKWYADSTNGSLQDSWLSQALHMDMSHYLLNDMLVKVDRMSMAHGLEVRVPFLDVDLIRFCQSMPDDLKLKPIAGGFESKSILKSFMRQKFPSSILDRKKHGFVVPLNEYLDNYWYDQIGDLLETHKDSFAALFEPKQLDKMLMQAKSGKKDLRFEMFDLLMLGHWFENTNKRYS